MSIEISLEAVIAVILWNTSYVHCLRYDTTNDKVGTIPELNVLQKIPVIDWTTSTEAENSYNLKETYMQAQHCEKSSEHDESEGWKGKWRKNQNNRIESANTNTNRNIFKIEGDASNISIHNEKKVEEGIEESKMKSHIILDNSSLLCMNLGMMANENKSSLTLRTESVAMISGCHFEVKSEISPFDLCFSQIQLTNLTLRFWNSQQTHMPPLFSTQMSGSKSHSTNCVSVCSSHFSSFQISSSPFLSSHFIEGVSLTDLIFTNISTFPTRRRIHFASGCGCSTLMNDCSFSSVCDVYDGGIVPSLNNPFTSLSASNSSFIGCFRKRNVECNGTEMEKKHPGRQNTTDNGTNSFIWCEWNMSKTPGEVDSYADGSSNGGAICMISLSSGTLSLKYCSLNRCIAFYSGGGIYCYNIKSVEIVNNRFNACTAMNYRGGGMCIFSIKECVRISGCEFQNCKANNYGGGLYLENFQVSEPGCIETENEGREGACAFDCYFSSCSITNNYGGGLRCYNIPVQVKMRSIQFISCNASSYGGGLSVDTRLTTMPKDGHYFYFLFFHECKCSAATPYGHDVVYFDYHNAVLNSDNPFKECYTTNTDNQRVCYASNYSNLTGWTYQHTEKKNWLNEKTIYVSVSGNDGYELCGAYESNPCLTVKKAFEMCEVQISFAITLMEGNHTSEATTIDIGSKKISVIGAGKDKSSIGTGALSSVGALFSVSTGYLGLFHMKVDCNSIAETSPSVFVVSDGSGSLSLEDVLISSSVVGTNVISSSVFVVALSQLRMIDVEVKDMKVSQPLFSEPSSGEAESEESFLSNVTIRNVNLTEGNGVVVAKNVNGEGTFVVSNTTIEECVCENGNGGGIHICLKKNGKVVVNGTSLIDGNKAKNNGGNGGRGGGMFVLMESGGCGLTIGQNVEFSKVNVNEASYGKDVFVHCGSGVFLESKVNTNTLAFFDTSTIPSDVLKLSGSENGDESGVIPLFVYFHSLGTKVIVDGSGGNGMNHNHCGFEGFGCLTIDYCANSRMSENVNEMEVVSSSSVKDEIEFSLFGVIISGRIISSEEEERMQVDVSDEGSATQDYFVGCSSSLTMRRLSFVVIGQLNSRRSAFIHSTSTINMTNCSVSFESGALTDGKIGYNIIDMAGGNLIVDGYVMESAVIMNGKSPITMTSGMKLDILNSRVSGVEVNAAGGNGGGGCLNVGMGVNGNVKIEESNFSSRCTGGSGMKGGGMMISVGKGGSLEMKNVNLSGCEVPTEDVEDGGRGLGGGMFVELPEEIGSFVLEGMEFEGCDGWKGKKMFVSGWDLSEIVNEEHLKWEIKEEEFGLLDELCGWERKTTGEEGYVIPLVVYLWRNWSGDGFVSREKGGDFSGCGFSEAPCSSVDHLISLRYSTLGEGESHINIVGSGLLQKSISFLSSSSLSITPVVSIEGEKEGTSLKVSEEGGMITSNVEASFTNLSFSLPNELVSQSSLIHSTSSSAASLSIKRCSFVCEDSTKETKYYLIKADGGSVVIEDCTLSQFNLGKGFVEFTADVKSIDMMNVSVSNTTISGSSLISLSQAFPTNVLISKARENTKQIVRVNSSSFVNITCVENRPCVMSVGSFLNGMECVIEGCVLTKCMSERSLEGGGMKMLMKRGESEVKVSGCSFGMCVCSTGNGRGGGMMIDALDPNGECSNTEMPPLGLRLENIRFMMNDAFVGKDVFIRCDSIDLQLNERLFGLDFSQEALKGKDSMCGSDGEGKADVDLIPLITFYYSSQVFVCVNGSDNRQCGAQNNPCESIGNAVQHIQRSVVNMILIDGEGMMGEECVIGDVRMVSMGREKATVHFERKMEERGEERSMMVFVNESVVERCLFVFGETFESTQKYVVKVKEGRMVMNECSFEGSASGMGKRLKNTLVGVEGGEMEMVRCTIRHIHHCGRLVVFCGESSRVIMSEIRIWDVESEGDVVVVEGEARVSVKEVGMENITIMGEWSVMALRGSGDGNLSNCSFSGCESGREKGGVVLLSSCEDVRIEMCDVSGGVNRADEERNLKEMNEKEEKEGRERICKWNVSMVGIERSRIVMEDTRIRECGKGGLSVLAGYLTVEKGEFENNNPFIEKYPSMRRNILCSDSGILIVSNLKGGDGLMPNSSLWILNDGCTLRGIAGERPSPFFIPKLEDVSVNENGRHIVVKFKGSLFVPCDLSFRLVHKTGDVELVETYPFEEDSFVSETEVIGRVPSENISAIADETEVSVMILFGKPLAATSPLILKNKTEPKTGDEKVVEGGKEGKSSWALIVIVIFAVLFLIVLVASIVATIRWRRAKEEAKKYKEIVNDNIRKDPKAFEMVTMEMSPEEQWRRAEREAERKNDERMKKRIYDTNMEHSESSEHLLSESGSTEYILGRDSDKIPQWALEKVEEEIQKRSPSPSISSTSTTDTSDTESTFVRMEDMCPTTSSMSNLVDAMACSSLHEKLIVDLRDSLFMLLHGRNKTKEMAIGTMEEREQTAAQILFWVANGALHSFDEMENPLSSFENLNPHIVLFSEHKVICIVMHSDFLSSDDSSDSSSISSLPVVSSSSSNISVMSERFTDSPPPSSAFEDDDDIRKECLRWKAPELLINKKMGATKESVAFSIGMMLWECLTLEIPFGEYDAETAGQKITFGERPSRKLIAGRGMDEVVGSCWEEEASKRMGLFEVKKELFSHFPANAVVITASDAIAYAESSESETDDEKEGTTIQQATTTTNTATTTSSTVTSTTTTSTTKSTLKTRENASVRRID